MKKIFVCVLVLALSSCYLKGDYTLGRRNMLNDFFYTYDVRYYEDNAFSSSEMTTQTISDFKPGVTRHAVPGGLVVSFKTVEKEVFSDEFVRPSKKGAMVSYTVPIEFSDEKVYRTIGEVDIDGMTYRLIEPNRYGDVLLIDMRGNIYHRIGRFYNQRLALLDTQFLMEPEDVYFMNETERRAGEENVVSGFSVRYAGIEDYRMVFKYTEVGPNGDRSLTEEKTYTFPMYDKNISFEGIRLEVLEADESGIDYRILSI